MGVALSFIKGLKASLSPVLGLFFCLLSLQAKPNAVENAGFPYVQDHTKHVYQAGNQNWCVTQGQDGVMYYGNSNGLLAYDGNRWQLYPMPNNQIVRSVAADNKERIYAGAFGEFGYWSYDTEGRFIYTSLINLVPERQPLTGEVWKIHTEGDKVIFQSFASIYIYENGKIDVVQAEAPFLFLFKAGNRYFAEVISKGLYELKNKKLELVAAAGVPGAGGIHSVLPYKEGQYLIGTSRDGLFYMMVLH